MRLQQELLLPQARIQKVKIELGADEHKITLEVITALTREVAETFGCRELIYAGNVPRSGVEKMVLEGSERDCDVHLQHEDFAFGTVVEEIGKYVAKMEGDGPKLVFHIKFTGYVITVADLIEHVKIDPLEIILKPAQIPLDLKDEKVQQPEQEGEESERLISAEQAEETKGEDEAPLAPAAVMGGTHQRGTRQQRGGRKPEVVPEEEVDFMADVPEVVQ